MQARQRQRSSQKKQKKKKTVVATATYEILYIYRINVIFSEGKHKKQAEAKKLIEIFYKYDAKQHRTRMSMWVVLEVRFRFITNCNLMVIIVVVE
ncbi:hypothetical protein T01_10902 [Trichinella spiralis]|uniref:Uncharacterized protein n=1 Tax=Trichinella spiralis TaxID=6334 RepID=A0A0V1B857_TRISP|nr:hypothetical protein T01_10902 [Trichinella spiralis]